MTTNNENLHNLLSKQDFLKKYPNLFEARELAWVIKNRHHNGFSRAIKKVTAKKILIDVEAASEWINNR